MNFFRLSFVFLLLNNSFVFSQRGALGAIPDEVIDTIEHPTKQFPKLRSNLPKSHDLSFLLPKILSQGQLGSCTSWASAYYAFTIVKRIENKNPSFKPFCPITLHSMLKFYYKQKCSKYNNYCRLVPCKKGSHISFAGDLLKKYGVNQLKSSENLFQCKKVYSLKRYKNRLYKWERLSIRVSSLKRALYENSPIVFQMDTHYSPC
jgi:hypothetical protein